MNQEIELISFLLALFVLGFCISQRQLLGRIRGWKWLLASYLTLTLSLGASVIEELWLFDFFNTLQHVASGVSGVCFGLWCCLGGRSVGADRNPV